MIGFPDATAIGVRSAPNLIRPAHIFRYLKQNRHAEVKAWSTTSSIAKSRTASGPRRTILRNVTKRRSTTSPATTQSWRRCSKKSTSSTALWDGDNMLASGAILDYGSIRSLPRSTTSIASKTSIAIQPRWPSSGWARTLVQVFAQTMDFVETGEKEEPNTFRNAECLRLRPRVRNGTRPAHAGGSVSHRNRSAT